MTRVSHPNAEKNKYFCAHKGHKIDKGWENFCGIQTSLALFLGVGERSEADLKSARPSHKRTSLAVIEITGHFNS